MFKKTQKNSIKEIYSSCFKEIKSLKKYLIVIIGLFFVSVFIGYLFNLGVLQNFLLEQIEEIAKKIQEFGFFKLLFFIFFNNSWVSFFALLFGILLGIVPLFLIILNGLMLGVVSKLVVSQTNFSSLWLLLPHGIFELTAVFIAFSIGFKTGFELLLSIGEPKQNNKIKSVFINFKTGLKIFVFVILPLLLFAAIIESILIFYF
jgi:stage II sporulation protein M